MEKSLKTRKYELIAAILVILLPLIQAGVIALFNFTKYGTGLSSPLWNDEAVYYSLIKAWATPGAHRAFGNPIGYFGFNGGHAIVGTGSAWNPAIIWPYALFARMFGLNLHTIWAANLTFVTLSVCLFLLIAKPDLKTKINLIVIEFFSAPMILYISTEMSEPLRYALTLVLAAMIYRIYADEKPQKLFAYVIVPLYIIFLVQIYIFFVFVVPVYMYGILRKKSKPLAVLSSILALMIVGGGSYYLLHLISSNYNIYKSEKLFAALQSGNVILMIKAALAMLFEGVRDVLNLALGRACHGLITWFVILMAILVIVCILSLMNVKKGALDRELLGASLFSILLFAAAFVTMYSPDPNTFFRSNAIVVLFAMYLLAFAGRNMILGISTVAFALGIFFVPANIAEYTTAERFLTKEEIAAWDDFEAELQDKITVDTDSDPWVSTVVVYTLEPKVIASVPAGAGVNMMLREDTIPTEAEYLFFSVKSENLRQDWLEQSFSDVYESQGDLIDDNYKLIWENDSYKLFKKK